MARVLVIDTCGARGYVALLDVSAPEIAQSERVLDERATQEQLLPAIEAVLDEAASSLASLQAIVVVAGPGSFTGVRIGLASAKGLCEAAGLPLVSLSRLAVLSVASAERPLSVWLQAGRGDVYAARFEENKPTSADAADGQQTLLSLEAAMQQAKGAPVLVCEQVLQAAMARAWFVSHDELARALRHAAANAVLSENRADVALSDALYLRVPDAELALKAKQA